MEKIAVELPIPRDTLEQIVSRRISLTECIEWSLTTCQPETPRHWDPDEVTALVTVKLSEDTVEKLKGSKVQTLWTSLEQYLERHRPA